MKKCPNCGSGDLMDVVFGGHGLGFVKSTGVVDSFKYMPAKGVACKVCGNVQVFADVEKLRQWAQKG